MKKLIIIIIICLLVTATIVAVVLILKKKKKNSCVSSCAKGQNCGQDSCGNSCGVCSGNQICADGTCIEPGAGYICTATGCESNCETGSQTEENYETRERADVCYSDFNTCAQNCTDVPCSSTYPNGACPSGTKCTDGECLYIGCPYMNSQYPIPTGVESGTFNISFKNQDLFVTSSNSISVPGIAPGIKLSPPFTWDYDSTTNILKANPYPNIGSLSCNLQAKDECWGTNCGSSSGSLCSSSPPSPPVGVLYCGNDENSPNKFILGTDFIFSIDAKAYIIPDIRTFIFGLSCGSCNQGGGTLEQFITYTLDESLAHVWTVTRQS